MSEMNRTLNEYAEMYAKKHKCTIEQAKKTAVVKAFELLVVGKENKND